MVYYTPFSRQGLQIDGGLGMGNVTVWLVVYLICLGFFCCGLRLGRSVGWLGGVYYCLQNRRSGLASCCGRFTEEE